MCMHVCVCVCEANLTGTQALMQTNTIRKVSTGGATNTHFIPAHDGLPCCSLVVISSYKLLSQQVLV